MYQAISVKEALSKINNDKSEGWFLPYIQRRYVWGSRYDADKYIYRLFDSIFRSYPLGTLILWNTDKRIPFREFLTDYVDDERQSRIVEKGKHGISKNLVYDGQQRLQTLFSCLLHTFNDRVLVFDLSFMEDAEDAEETGFAFFERDADLSPAYIRMNELFSTEQSKLAELKRTTKTAFKQVVGEEAWESTGEPNFDQLWRTFCSEGHQPLVKYVVSDTEERRVNEVFRRLNTGGIALTQSELLFADLSESSYNIQETVREICDAIQDQTGGFYFDESSILRIMSLIITGSLRIDVERTSDTERSLMTQLASDIRKPILSFFSDFLYGEFKINRASLISKTYALFPLIVYLYALSKYKRKSYKKLSPETKLMLKQFFIKSQLKDWRLQGFIDKASRLILEKALGGRQWDGSFPFDEIVSLLNGKRGTDIRPIDFENDEWFSLKILLPTKEFRFLSRADGRSDPELDHIFPKGLRDNATYRKDVDTIWNLQPVKGEDNDYKRKKDPRIFFREDPSRLNHYDFVPTLESVHWSDETQLIAYRQKKMLEYFTTEYKIRVKKN